MDQMLLNTIRVHEHDSRDKVEQWRARNRQRQQRLVQYAVQIFSLNRTCVHIRPRHQPERCFNVTRRA